MAALGNLPEDVTIEILSMLPAESLLRFKSVCKFWYALINDPKFIRKHLSNSIQHEHVLLKRSVPLRIPKPQYTQSENIFTIFKSIDRFESFSDVYLPLDENFRHFDICGHSHGLLCLAANRDRDIFLCNPITREFRELPPSILLLSEDLDDYDLDSNSVGFGYDSKSKDFKVVRTVIFDGPGLQKVEIYDLSKDRWREIENPPYGYAISPPYFQMYHEGTYYWMKSYGGSEMIQTFDMSEEILDRILVPDEIEVHDGKSLGVVNESIVLINHGVRTLDIWEMYKDHESGGFSWSKLLAITDTVFKIEKPLLFVSSDELLIEVDEGPEIDELLELLFEYDETPVTESNEELVVFYNIKTRHLKQLSIKGNLLRFQATFFVKSLVSVKGGRMDLVLIKYIISFLHSF